MNPDHHLRGRRSDRVRYADIHALTEPYAAHGPEFRAILHDIRAGILDNATKLESFWRDFNGLIVTEGSKRRRMIEEDPPLRHANAGEFLIGRKYRLQRDIDDLPDLSNAILHLSPGWSCVRTAHRYEQSHSIRSMRSHAAGTLSKESGRRSSLPV